jgi:hypothetical protein
MIRALRARDGRPSAIGLGVGLVGLLLAAAAGLAAGWAVSRDEPPAPAREATVTTDRFSVTLPSGATRQRRPPTLPGWTPAPGSVAFDVVTANVIVGVEPLKHKSLLPPGLLRSAENGSLVPRTERLPDRTVWRYDLGLAPKTGAVEVLVLPTTSDVLTVTCLSDPSLQLAGQECKDTMSRLQLTGAAPLVPRAETAALMTLPKVLEQLNATRKRERANLAATRTPEARSATAQRLAAAWRRAGKRLAPMLAGAATELAPLTASLQSSYLGLADASRRRDRAAATRAGAAIKRDEERVQALIKRLTAPSAS